MNFYLFTGLACLVGLAVGIGMMMGVQSRLRTAYAVLALKNSELLVRAADLSHELLEMEYHKNEAYTQRNAVVVALANCGYPSGVTKVYMPDAEDPEFENVVRIDLPTGQVSWIFHDRDIDLFDSLPAYDKQWDGSDIETRAERLRLFCEQSCEKRKLQKEPAAA